MFRYTEEDMVEAVAKASDIAFNFGYWKAAQDIKALMDPEANPCFVVKQATVILQKDESERGEL